MLLNRHPRAHHHCFQPNHPAIIRSHSILNELRNQQGNIVSNHSSLIILPIMSLPLWPKPAGLAYIFKHPGNVFGGFSFKQYLKNKEYECLLGVAVVFLALYFF